MKILLKAQAGSHLFGTNTPESDMDFKGIYIPSRRDILLNKVQPTISIKRDKALGEKNTKDDVDVEYFSFQKFMTMLYEGQTVALELLWTPDEMIVECDPTWTKIREIGRKLWVHKKVTSFVGYCKTQADKYGVKGSRMAAIKETIQVLENLRQDYSGSTRLSNDKIWSELRSLRDKEHIKFGAQETVHGVLPYVEICDRKFQDNQKLSYAIDSLHKIYESYGHRAKQAELNEGIDWKALSHAYRVCCQAIELLSEHKLTLPLKEENLKIVRDVKLGLIPFKEFQPLLESKLEEVLKWEKDSTLPEEFYYKEWCEEYVIWIYEKFIN